MAKKKNSRFKASSQVKYKVKEERKTFISNSRSSKNVVIKITTTTMSDGMRANHGPGFVVNLHS